jgi:hypothetical protein
MLLLFLLAVHPLLLLIFYFFAYIAIGADAVPADAVPVDAVNVDAVPVDAVNVDYVPVDPVPADAVAVDSFCSNTSLLSPFVSYEEKEVLCIRSLLWIVFIVINNKNLNENYPKQRLNEQHFIFFVTYK